MSNAIYPTRSVPTLWSSRRSRSEKKRSPTEPQGIETDTATYGGLEGTAELSDSMLPENAVEGAWVVKRDDLPYRRNFVPQEPRCWPKLLRRRYCCFSLRIRSTLSFI